MPITREDANPDGIRHLDGTTNPTRVLAPGDKSPHKFVSLGSGQGSGEGRYELAKSAAKVRGRKS
jgi:hypothetical protein